MLTQVSESPGKTTLERKQTEVAVLRNVTQRYGNQVALHSTSLALHAGEVVALLGANGAGKTTAVKLLLGLLSPTRGEVKVFGASPRQAATRTRIGAMLQVAKVPETLKVGEYLTLFRSYYPHPLPKEELIEMAGLRGLEGRLFSQLSGGQKQRLLFAIACCGNPDLIFLDEPTLGMDIETRHALWAQVRRFASQGKTVLLTTHYLEEADSLANRIVVISHGEVIAEGTPAHIKSSVAGRTIRCHTTLDTAWLQSLPTVTQVNQSNGAVIITATAVETVVRQMLQRDASLSGLEIASPALEDAFLALTRANSKEAIQ